MTVGVTDKIRSWVLPKNLIIHHSTFFAAALNGSFLESSLNSIKLIEDDPAVFELFVQWLYLGKIDTEPEELEAYLMAWVLGDKLGCSKFKDYVIIRIIEYHNNNYLNASSVEYAYNNTPSTSELRQWALMQLWYESHIGQLENGPDSWKTWNTLVAETKDLAHNLALLLIHRDKPRDPFSNKQKYLSESTSQS